MPNGGRQGRNRSRSQKRAGNTGAPNKGMICICVPQEQIQMQCSCNQPQQQENRSRSRSRRANSTRMDISDMNESVYETVQDTSLLEIEDDPSNASKLGLTYRVGSFRWSRRKNKIYLFLDEISRK